MMKDNTDSGDGSAETGNIYISSEHIIQEVQKFRCLYDPSDPDHKDRDVVRDAWLTVTEAVVGEPWANLNTAEKNEAAKEVARRWKNIRDAMRKSLKPDYSRNSKKGMRKPYAFHDELTFLKDIMNSEEKKDNRTKLRIRPEPQQKSGTPVQSKLRLKRKSGVVDASDDASATLEPDEQDETPDSSPATRISPRPKRKMNKPQQILHTTRRDDFEREQSPVCVPHNTASNKPEFKNHPAVNHPYPLSAGKPESENPDRLFLLSLLPRVSSLSSRNKLDFQIKAMQILQGFEKKRNRTP